MKKYLTYDEIKEIVGQKCDRPTFANFLKVKDYSNDKKILRAGTKRYTRYLIDHATLDEFRAYCDYNAEKDRFFENIFNDIENNKCDGYIPVFILAKKFDVTQSTMAAVLMRNKFEFFKDKGYQSVFLNAEKLNKLRDDFRLAPKKERLKQKSSKDKDNDLAQNLFARNAENDELSRKICDLKFERDNLKRELAEAQTEIETLKKLTAQVADLSFENKTLKAKIYELENKPKPRKRFLGIF